jgi:glycosyltransferase involved in cell wall biosynthesis
MPNPVIANRDILTSAASSPMSRPRVGLVCDFLEENWPSMDLVAEMLATHLEAGHSSELSTERLCPAMAFRFTRMPGLGHRAFFRNADRLWNRFIDYPRWLRPRVAEFDLFHVIDHSYAQLAHYLPPERTIVTCHDLDAFRCLLQPEAEPRPRWFRAMMSRVLDGLQKTAHIITGSNTVRDELLQHAVAPAERISVIHNGVHPSCVPWPDPAADAEAARLLPSDSKGVIWMLNVGSTIRRKRLDVLLRVLGAVRRELPQVRLIRVGGGWTPEQLQLARDLEVEQAVVVLPRLTRNVLAAIYRRADLLVHSADAEGFGLPLIEAQACGCPVIASDLKVLREIGGKAAGFVPVGDILAWKEAVIAMFRERIAASSQWELRRRQGITNASAFSWSEAARQTADIYKSVLDRANVTAAERKY